MHLAEKVQTKDARMKTTLFCFSGTGNSYYVAQTLATQLGDATVRMIPSLFTGEEIEMTEQVGFVFPTYKGFPPTLVKEFILKVFAKQDLSPIKYLFLINTRYKFPGYCMVAMHAMLREAGCLYSYANHVVMPDGYVPLLPVPSEKTMDTLYAKADEKLRTIAEDIRTEQFRLIPKVPFTRIAITHIMPVVHLASKDFAQQFSVLDSCISCTLCYRMCPSNNITMQEGKPVFSNNCTGCLGCYHRCPVQAITLQKKVHEGRYLNKRSGYSTEYWK